MPRNPKYPGAAQGYEPDIDWLHEPKHKLTVEQRKARRQKNQKSKLSRDKHRSRNKHGH